MDKLIEKIVEKQNPTVAGLDPKLAYIPEYIRSASYEKYGKTLEGAADALLQFSYCSDDRAEADTGNLPNLHLGSHNDVGGQDVVTQVEFFGPFWI